MNKPNNMMKYITNDESINYIAVSYLLNIPILRSFMNSNKNKTLQKMYTNEGFVYNCFISSEELKKYDISNHITFGISLNLDILNNETYKTTITKVKEIITTAWKAHNTLTKTEYPNINFENLESLVIEKFYEFIMKDDDIVKFLTYSRLFDLPILKAKFLQYEYYDNIPIVNNEIIT